MISFIFAHVVDRQAYQLGNRATNSMDVGKSILENPRRDGSADWKCTFLQDMVVHSLYLPRFLKNSRTSLLALKVRIENLYAKIWRFLACFQTVASAVLAPLDSTCIKCQEGNPEESSSMQLFFSCLFSQATV